MGLFFPRNDEEMTAGPKRSRIPLVYVTSRGNRDGRPLPTAPQLADMGYKACIDAITTLLVNFHYTKKCLQEIYRTGTYTGTSFQENIDARQQIEDLVGLERFYECNVQGTPLRTEGELATARPA
jgi:methylisocitrate lyase